MRRALSSLTTRGRTFLTAGVSVTLAAWLSSQGAVVPVGILAVLLPLLALLWVSRAAPDLEVTRTVTPPVVSVGQVASVDLTMTNRSRRPTGLLLVEEALPYVLGSRPRFVLPSTQPGRSVTTRYGVRSDVRGKHAVGPLTIRLTDPFGLVEMPSRDTSATHVTVTPRVVPLTSLDTGGAWTGSGDNRPRSFAAGSAEDVTVREYRRGDDLRRVHWRSSARVGELMVRREEQPWQSRATVYIDNRAAVHVGHGAGSTLEVAVQAAASVAAHLVRQGFSVRLVSATGERLGAEWHTLDASAGLTPLLEQLAVMTTTPLTLPETRWLSEPGNGGLVVAVLGRVTEQDSQFLGRLGLRSTDAVALVLDTAAWASGRAGDEPAVPPELGTAGWRAVALGPGDDLDTRWRALARGSDRGALR